MTARNSFSFRREPQTVRSARRALDEFEGEFPQNRLYDASLCLSELVTNAVQHPGAGGDLVLTVAVDEARLRVEVADRGRGFDPGPPTEGDERGWGLFIVDSLADNWGVDPGEGTVVWFEIAREERAGEPGRAESEGGQEGGDSRADGLLRATALRLRSRLAAP
ncbi:MAG TPA: ATP-binding protein [Thermoleophilaceae bacterium]